MTTSKELRVGAFVLAGLFVAGIIIFLIGDEKRVFAPKAVFHTSFSDVQGLKTGAPVRLGGLDIGTVSSVGHSSEPRDNRIYVDLHIVKAEASRVRLSTVAEVSNRGLLGDKMIELEEGSPESPLLPPGGTIRSKDPTDFGNLFAELGTMSQRTDRILANLEVLTGALADPAMREDLRGGVHATSLILKEVATGSGYAHRLLADPSEADRVSQLVSHFSTAAAKLDQTLAEASKAMAQLNQGPGFAHELLYGDRGASALANFGDAAGEVATTLRGVRDGSGIAHALVYGPADATTRITDNVGAMTDDLRKITADLRAGKGTLGALLVDPSVYEDVKRVLGNVERNDTLRALVRYSIKQDEKQAQTVTPDPSRRTAR